MSPRCPCQCKGMGLTASRGVWADAALWKFQYIRLPSNSFTCVCEGLFTVTYTAAAMAAHATCVCYSRRMLETFSVSLTTPHTATLCSACNQYTSKANTSSSIKEERHVWATSETQANYKFATHRHTELWQFRHTQAHTQVDGLAVQMGWCEITPSLL